MRLPAETDDELGSLAMAFNRMATALEDQIDALVEAHDRERRFVADVSHELRTPLTALVNEAAMLQVGWMHLRPGIVGSVRCSSPTWPGCELWWRTCSRCPASTRITGLGPFDVDVERFVAAVIEDRHPAARLRVAAPGGFTPTGFAGTHRRQSARQRPAPCPGRRSVRDCGCR